MEGFDKIDNVVHYSLFTPKSMRSLLRDYPELKNNQAIADLKIKSKILFAYYLGCETSPLYEWYNSDHKLKRSKAIEKAIKHSGLKVEDELFEEYLENRFPSDLKAGVEAFMRYKMSIRMRAKMLQEKAMRNYEKIIDVDINGEQFFVTDKEGNPTAEKDYDKVKKYTEISLKVLGDMEKLVEKMEYGYGIKTVDNGSNSDDDDGDTSLLDKMHENKL